MALVDATKEVRKLLDDYVILQAKLTKAVAALERIRYLPVRKGGGVVVADIARQVLEEITADGTD